ncbi:Exo-poly-alpha-D-galacturonosidase precursor [compost metagenome]
MKTVYNIKEFGAVGDGQTLDSAAIQAAIDACTQQGGGKVIIPNGRFLTGTVILKSGVDLHLEPTARIVSSMNEQDFLQDPVFGRRGLICAFQAERISVTGTGTIDGQGERFLTPDDGVGHHVLVPLVDFRPKLIDIEGCTDVLFRDVTRLHCSENNSIWG